MNKRVAVVLSLWGIQNALAAVTTDAVCSSDFDWANNELGQSPCILAGYLQAACGTGDWNVPALPANNRYNAPNTTTANACICSSVTYSALSMCAACQGRNWLNWPGWKYDCPVDRISAGNYTQDIPKNTSIPYWAYQNPDDDPSSNFNVTTARTMDSENVADTKPAVHTNTTNTSQSSSKSNNTGIIVGAVLGAIAIIIMIVCAAVFIFRKRRSSRESSAPSKRYINNWSKKVKAGRPPSATDDSRSRWEAESAWGEKVTSYEVSNIHRPQSVTSFERQARSPTPSSKTFPTGNMSNPGKFGARTTNEHAITPYILSPIVDSHTSDTTTLYGSASPDHLRTSPVAVDRRSSRVGRSSSEWFKPKRRNSSQSSVPTQPILLPSTVEYSGTKKDIQPFVQQLPPTLYPAGAPTGYYNPDDPSTYPTPIVGPPRRNSNDSSRHPLSGSYMSHGSGPTPPEHGNSRHSHTLSGGGSQHPTHELTPSGLTAQPSGRVTPQMGRISPAVEPTAPFLPSTHTRSPSSASPTGRFNAIMGRIKPTRRLSNQSGSDFDDPNRVALDQMGNDWSPHAPNNAR